MTLGTRFFMGIILIRGFITPSSGTMAGISGTAGRPSSGRGMRKVTAPGGLGGATGWLKSFIDREYQKPYKRQDLGWDRE